MLNTPQAINVIPIGQRSGCAIRLPGRRAIR